MHACRFSIQISTRWPSKDQTLALATSELGCPNAEEQVDCAQRRRSSSSRSKRKGSLMVLRWRTGTISRAWRPRGSGQVKPLYRSAQLRHWLAGQQLAVVAHDHIALVSVHGQSVRPFGHMESCGTVAFTYAGDVIGVKDGSLSRMADLCAHGRPAAVVGQFPATGCVCMAIPRACHRCSQVVQQNSGRAGPPRHPAKLTRSTTALGGIFFTHGNDPPNRHLTCYEYRQHSRNNEFGGSLPCR